MAELVGRAAAPEVREVILALPATVDGQTTAHYLAERLAGADVTLSSLARGVPVGGELDWLDDGTHRPGAPRAPAGVSVAARVDSRRICV